MIKTHPDSQGIPRTPDFFKEFSKKLQITRDQLVKKYRNGPQTPLSGHFIYQKEKEKPAKEGTSRHAPANIAGQMRWQHTAVSLPRPG